MNKQETLQIMSIMRAAYPTFYRQMSNDDYSDTVLLWEDMFKDDPFQLVSVAVKSFIATDAKGYPPHIGAVRESMLNLTAHEELTEMEAWTLVRGKMSAYATREDFLCLPPAVQRAVGGSAQLVQWALTDMESLPVIMSNFMRSYRSALETEHKTAMLPKGVQAFISGMGTIKLGAGKEENSGADES